MLLKKYHSIMEKPEEHRNRWALGLSISISLVILVGFAFYKGYLSVEGGVMAKSGEAKSQMANVVAAESVPSPIQNTKETFGAAFGEIGKKYEELKDTISDVLVPFVTGIEVYERE